MDPLTWLDEGALKCVVKGATRLHWGWVVEPEGAATRGRLSTSAAGYDTERRMLR